MVVQRVPLRERWVFLDQRLEPGDGAGVPPLAEVEVADAVLRHAEPIARFTVPRLHLGQQLAVRILGDEGLELLHGLARFALVALGTAHLPVVTHSKLVLRVIRAPVRRVEAEELLELVHRQHERFDVALAEVRVTQPELRIRAERALRVVVDEAAEELARREPLLVVQQLGASLEEELVGLRNPGRDRVLLPAAGAGRDSERARDEKGCDASDRTVLCHATDADASQRYSSARPSASDTVGWKPRSVRARDVSA